MANTATLTLETVQGSGLRFRARSGSAQETLTDSGNGMQAPSPTELLLIALAGCTAMDVISILRKQRQEVHAYQVEVAGERRDEHPRAFTRIDLVHRLTGRNLRTSAIKQAIYLSDTKYCSVYASLSSAIEIKSRFEIVPEPKTA